MKRALVLVLVASCTGRELDTPTADLGTRQPQTYDAFASDYAQAICARYIACGLMDVAQTAACVAFTLNDELPVPPSARDGLASGAYAYDPADARACLDGIATSTCTFPSLPCGELDVLHATLAPGAACTSNETCTTGSCHCDSGGTCAAPAPIGESCTSGCVAGAMCSGADVCVATPGEGETCDFACAAGLTCIVSEDGHGACRTAGASGAPCLPLDEDFDGRAGCQSGLACDFTQPTPVCLPVAAAGAACGSIGGCAPGLACVGLQLAFNPGAVPFVLPGAVAGTCTPQLVAGSACSSSPAADVCPAFTTCIAGTCTPTPVLGESCAAYRLCIGSFCDPTTFTCIALVAEGRACDPSREMGNITQCAQDGSGYANPGLFCDGFTGACGSNADACE